MTSPISWFDGKAKLGPRIAGLFPEHLNYVAPFGGSLGVLLAKPPARVEIYNAAHPELANFLHVLREPKSFRQIHLACEATRSFHSEFPPAHASAADPVESARRFILGHYCSRGLTARGASGPCDDALMGNNHALRRWLAGIGRFPSLHRRLANIRVEAEDWSSLITRHDTPDTLFYLDQNGLCGHGNLPDRKLRESLVQVLAGIRGMAIWSGKGGGIEGDLEALGWQRVDYLTPPPATPRRRRQREYLWLSPAAAAAQPTPANPAREAMRVGAYRTHRLRVSSTEEGVLRAIDKLRRSGERVSFSAVARVLDMSREHLSRRYRHLFESA
ncbi:MAG TPA: hypothetical protein VFF03_16925 [Rhodocyclaceae bacterium]|nr:hypothetical protein [Rhodocyclaceae bacterium]